MNGDPRPTPPTLSGNAITADEELRVYRKFVIEECALVAERYLEDSDHFACGNDVAAAIRALKDKP